MKQQKIFGATVFISILILFGICFLNTKYAKDYSAIDYVKIKNIVSQNKTQTNKMIMRYDINKDGVITNFDANIVRQMLDGYYDSYQVIGKYKGVKRRNK